MTGEEVECRGGIWEEMKGRKEKVSSPRCRVPLQIDDAAPHPRC